MGQLAIAATAWDTARAASATAGTSGAAAVKAAAEEHRAFGALQAAIDQDPLTDDEEDRAWRKKIGEAGTGSANDTLVDVKTEVGGSMPTK